MLHNAVTTENRSDPKAFDAPQKAEL
jgi:hypothetical protein